MEIILTKDDAATITQYIRDAHGGYNGPVFIDLNGLESLHMAFAQAIVTMAIVSARYESRYGF